MFLRHSAFVVAIGLAVAATAVPVKYSVRDLGVLPATDNSLGRGLNNLGHTTGYSYQSGNFDLKAFRWVNGTLTDLGGLGGGSAQGMEINDAGVIVGIAENTTNQNRAFRWTQGGGMQNLGTLGGNFSEARAINSAGVIVGAAQNASQSFRGFRWEQGTGMVALDTLSGATTVADDINTAGVIVGGSDVSGNRRAVRWVPGFAIENLGTLPGDVAASAYAVNAGGTIVGYSSPGSTFRAFIWRQGQGMSELTGLFNYDNRPWDINDTGDVVGSSWLSQDGNTTQAVIWPGGGAVQNLNNLLVNGAGWVLKAAYGINSSGQIVGYGTRNGETRGFILTPIRANARP